MFDLTEMIYCFILIIFILIIDKLIIKFLNPSLIDYIIILILYGIANEITVNPRL